MNKAQLEEQRQGENVLKLSLEARIKMLRERFTQLGDQPALLSLGSLEVNNKIEGNPNYKNLGHMKKDIEEI
jgi:hypothetical protein